MSEEYQVIGFIGAKEKEKSRNGKIERQLRSKERGFCFIEFVDAIDTSFLTFMVIGTFMEKYCAKLPCSIILLVRVFHFRLGRMEHNFRSLDVLSR